MELTGYNVVVTGGSGGIGSALITGLIQSGASVHNLDLQSPAPSDAKFYKTDLTDENSVKASLSSIKNKFTEMNFIKCGNNLKRNPIWLMRYVWQ